MVVVFVDCVGLRLFGKNWVLFYMCLLSLKSAFMQSWAFCRNLANYFAHDCRISHLISPSLVLSATVPKDASGNYILTQACNDVPDTPTTIPGVFAPTKLPLVSDTQCKQWITCFNQQLENASQNPPEAGSCNSNFYNRDRRTCTFTLPQGSCPFI